MQEGEAVVPLLPECELEAHDLYQAQLDCLQLQSVSQAQPDRIIKKSLIAPTEQTVTKKAMNLNS